jgi:hypothetical protein
MQTIMVCAYGFRAAGAYAGQYASRYRFNSKITTKSLASNILLCGNAKVKIAVIL